jgi:tetratricopeptide (TPR) repeat protein
MKKQIISLLSLVFILYGCAGAPVKDGAGQVDGKVRKSPIPQEEQEMRSAEAFNDLLEITSSSPDRDSILPAIQNKYLEIINNYPDAPLAQESYYRLIGVFLKDYYPPDYKSAEQYYADFIRSYPDSKFKYLVNVDLGRSYFRSQQWEKLMVLTKYAFDDYKKKGSAGSPTLLFMYAESNYNLGNINEAEEAFRAILKMFPTFADGVRSQARLDEIEAGKTK